MNISALGDKISILNCKSIMSIFAVNIINDHPPKSIAFDDFIILFDDPFAECRYLPLILELAKYSNSADIEPPSIIFCGYSAEFISCIDTLTEDNIKSVGSSDLLFDALKAGINMSYILGNNSYMKFFLKLTLFQKYKSAELTHTLKREYELLKFMEPQNLAIGITEILINSDGLTDYSIYDSYKNISIEVFLGIPYSEISKVRQLLEDTQ